MYPLAGFRAGVGRKDEHISTARTGGANHSFRRAELAHGARGEVGAENNEAADEAFGRVGFFDSGEDRALSEMAYVERELHQFVGFFDRLSGQYFRDAEIDRGEGIDVD